jgi:hypothetical protein
MNTVEGWEHKTCGDCRFRVADPRMRKKAVPDWAPDWAKEQAGSQSVSVMACRRRPPTSGIDDGIYRYPEVAEDTPACAEWQPQNQPAAEPVTVDVTARSER